MKEQLINQLVQRVFASWRTTVAGVLFCVVWMYTHPHLDSQTVLQLLQSLVLVFLRDGGAARAEAEPEQQ